MASPAAGNFQTEIEAPDPVSSTPALPEMKPGSRAAKKKQQSSVPLWRLFQYAGPFDVLLMAVGSLGAVVAGASLPMFSLLFGNLINAFGSNQSNTHHMLDSVGEVCLDMFYLGCGTLLAAYVEVAPWMLAGDRQAAKIRSLYLRAQLRQDVAFFDQQGGSAGEAVSRLSGDMALVQDAMGEKVRARARVGSCARLAIGCHACAFIGNCIHHLSTFVVGYVIGLIKCWQLALVILAVTPVLMLSGKFQQAVLTGLASKGQEAYAEAGTIAEQTIGSIRTVHSFTGEARARRAYSRALRTSVAVGVRAGFARGAGVGSMYGILYCSWALAFWYGSTLLARARPSVAGGDVVAAFFAVIIGGKVASQGTATRHFVRGQTRVGRTVLLDGRDLRDIQLKWLRQQMGLVSQEPVLFATSIAKNVMYGKEGATQEEVEAAAKAANAHSFISKLPQGYDTQVGERGVQMSGGQKQRIAIARAIIRNPRILLLDEATSALDASSERVVQEALDGLMHGRTTLVVAHRLSTIRQADLIAVCQAGQLVEMGDHAELLAQPGGAYAALIQLQQQQPQLQPQPPQEGTGKAGLAPDKSRTVQREEEGRQEKTEGDGEGKERDGELEGGAVATAAVSQGGTADAAKGGATTSPSSTFWRILRLSRPEYGQLSLGAAFSCLAGTISPVYAFIMAAVITTYFESDKRKLEREVRTWCLVYVGLAVAAVASMSLQHGFLGWAGERLTRRMRELLFASIVRQEVAWFDRPENASGALVSRLASDSTHVRGLLADRLSVLTQSLATVATAVGISLVLEWRMALVVLSLMPLIIGAGFMQNAFFKGFSSQADEMYARANQVAGEAIGSIRTVASLGAEDRIRALYDACMEFPLALSFRKSQMAGASLALSQFLLFGTFGLSLCWRPSAARSSSAGSPGTIAALVGPSGGGKSTVVSLVERFYDPAPLPGMPPVGGATGGGASAGGAAAGGSESRADNEPAGVLIDGVDVRDLDLRWLRRHVALVSQEPALFATTIRENILYGREGASEAEVEQVARDANVHAFISSLADGYNTQVGERGVQLSGGQKQRIAIARAMLKDPRILLLDEATSALDAESEHKVQEALDRLMHGRTTLVVAHRLSTIRKAHVIAVVQQGMLVEQGTHEELMSMPRAHRRQLGTPGGTYCQLVKRLQGSSARLQLRINVPLRPPPPCCPLYRLLCWPELGGSI
eukprot:jgi/Mesen1/3826/ME000207S02835